MLQLKNIFKYYGTQSEQVQALKNLSIDFRDNEFVSILGPSGCGKTTLLNILGGLDRYTSGDLVINGKSTKKFKDKNWDSYRNHSVGFVFQNYNLIPHQSILANVELALTLAGMKKKQRRQKAKEILEKVGLGDKIHKKPTQLSGGQMQRVAIARALVGDPDILLADEPTGALDSKNSYQIMELLKEIAQDKLVIMVTHNPELAEKYSSRIVKLLDGEIVDDSNPFKILEEEEVNGNIKENVKSKQSKTKMRYSTALSLSFKNLLTKKGRTILTSFAGSIGIIGIALILSLSNGMQEYISQIQQETLSQYPIQISATSVDMSSFMQTSANQEKDEEQVTTLEDGQIGSLDDVTASVKMYAKTMVTKNNLTEFKKYLDDNKQLNEYISSIEYLYDIDPQIYDPNVENGVIQLNPNTLTIRKKRSEDVSSSAQSNEDVMFNVDTNFPNVFNQLISSKDFFDTQYTLLSGRIPEKYNEVVLVVNETNQVSDSLLYTLNFKDRNEFEEIKKEAEKGNVVELSSKTFTFDDFLGKKFKLVNQSEYYIKQNGIWENVSDDAIQMKNIVKNAEELEIVGILKLNENSYAGTTGIGYTEELIDHIVEKAKESEIVKEQLANPDKNILTNLSFDIETYIDNLTKKEMENLIFANADGDNIQMQMFVSQMSEDELRQILKTNLADESTLETNLKKMGYISKETPYTINIYPKDFDSKDKIQEIITMYNQSKKDEGKEEYEIKYTDYIGLMVSSVTSMINVITGVLIAFVAISLVVSSIMIAIITYISVLERTKEIGILRSIGASKKDVSRVFNAETIIEGVIAGCLGVSITIALNTLINQIIQMQFKVENLSQLPFVGGVGLICLSMFLTLIAGLIPSRMASKKDPAVALRTE